MIICFKWIFITRDACRIRALDKSTNCLLASTTLTLRYLGFTRTVAFTKISKRAWKIIFILVQILGYYWIWVFGIYFNMSPCYIYEQRISYIKITGLLLRPNLEPLSKWWSIMYRPYASTSLSGQIPVT